MNIKFKRNGRKRHWKTINGREKTEEVIDVYVNEKPLVRGMCYNIFKRATGISLEKDEERNFKMEETHGGRMEPWS